METKFYRCRHCGNVIIKVVDSKVPVVCCGEKMEELIPNTVDASNEKHVPKVTFLDGCSIKVEVGSVPHPMTPEHHICFIYVAEAKLNPFFAQVWDRKGENNVYGPEIFDNFKEKVTQ